MSNKNESKKQILKSSSIIGGASVLTILIGLVKVKFLAILLGPAGIGLMGVLTTIMATGRVIFGMGLGTSGVRELAINSESIEKTNLVRKALFLANLLLGLLAVITIYMFRDILSLWFFQSADYKDSIFIIGVGVLFSLILGSQTALLQGLRKVSESAKVKVIGALISTIFGLLIIYSFGESGLSFFVITLPLANCLVALYYCRKLPKLNDSSFNFSEIKTQWKNFISLGFAFMLTDLATVVSQLIVRSILNQKLDIDAVGYFQASWTISMTYISFILGAMAADYYPRLTQKINNKCEANKLVNEQTEIAIIFSAPILLGMLAFSPVVIYLLYSSEFSNSIEILRWQVFGDVLKLISWPLSFIILAKGFSKLFFITQLIWNMSYIFLVYFGVDYFGIEITGYAFAISYFISLICYYYVVKSINGFKWSNSNIKLAVMLIFSSLSLLLLSYYSFIATMAFGSLFVIGSMFYAINVVLMLDIKNKKVKKILSIYERIFFSLSIKR